MKRIIGILAAAAVALGLAVAVAAAPAGAATRACVQAVTTHNGVQANWCASQDLTAPQSQTPTLALSTTNKSGVYSRLTLKTIGQNEQTDFQFYPIVLGGSAKVFEWSPRGQASGLCLDVANNQTVPVLKYCTADKLSQQWDASQIGAADSYDWVNAATGTALTAPVQDQYARLTMGDGSGFTFDQSGS